MKRHESKKEGLRPNERLGNNTRSQTHFDASRQQNILEKKRENVCKVTDKYQIVIKDIKKTLDELLTVTGNFGETSLSLYNKLGHIQDMMRNYQTLAGDVKRALWASDNLQTYNWTEAEDKVNNYEQQINQFFNRDVKGILQGCYNHGIQEYNAILAKFPGNGSDQIMAQRVQDIANETIISDTFVQENWERSDLEKEQIRKGAFNVLNHLNKNIEELKSFQQTSNTEQSESYQAQQGSSRLGANSYEQQQFFPDSYTYGESTGKSGTYRYDWQNTNSEGNFSQSQQYDYTQPTFKAEESSVETDSQHFSPSLDDPVIQNMRLKQKLSALQKNIRRPYDNEPERNYIPLLKNAADGIKDMYRIESRKKPNRRNEQHIKNLEELEKAIRILERYILQNSSEIPWEDKYATDLQSIKTGIESLKTSRTGTTDFIDFLQE